MTSPRASDGFDPLVSVCLPVHNDGPFIGKCLESILRQTYARIEIVVSDNASTDDTSEIIRKAADPRVRYDRNPENIGPFPNWNRCIARASGEFVAVFHADDIYEPTIVEEEAGFLRAHPEAGAVFTGALKMDEEDRIVDELGLPGPLRGKELFSFPELLRAFLEHWNFLMCPTFMARRSVLDRAGGFDPERFGTAADAGMWFRILEHAPIGVIDRPLMRYRVGKNQATFWIEHLRTVPADHFRVMDHCIAHPLAGDAASPGLLEKYETSRILDEARCLMNLIARGELVEARRLSRRIYASGEARKYLRTWRRFRYLVKRVFYSLLLEAGLAEIAAPLLIGGTGRSRGRDDSTGKKGS